VVDPAPTPESQGVVDEVLSALSANDTAPTTDSGGAGPADSPPAWTPFADEAPTAGGVPASGAAGPAPGRSDPVPASGAARPVPGRSDPVPASGAGDPPPGRSEPLPAATAGPPAHEASPWRMSIAPLPQAPAAVPQVVVQRVMVPVAVVDEPAPSNQGLWLLILVLAFVLVLAAVALEIIYLTPLVRHTGSGRGLGLVVGLLAR